MKIEVPPHLIQQIRSLVDQIQPEDYNHISKLNGKEVRVEEGRSDGGHYGPPAEYQVVERLQDLRTALASGRNSEAVIHYVALRKQLNW